MMKNFGREIILQNKEDESNDNTTNDSTSNAPIVEKCVFNGELVQGAEYNDGTYIYRYQQKGVHERFENASTDVEGWGVILDPSKYPTKVVGSPCSTIGNKPIVYTNFMFYKHL